MSARKTTTTTRYAQYKDLPQVACLYWEALEELQSILCKPDPERAYNLVLESWAKAPCILLEKAGEMIGFYGLSTAIPKYSRQACLVDYMFYIKPEHRNLTHAKMLCDAVKKLSRDHTLPVDLTYIFTSTPQHTLNARARLFHALGAEITGLKGVFT